MMQLQTPPLPPQQQSLAYAARTTVAATVSLLAARACQLPEAYWAAITTIVVMQSTLGAAWDVSVQRLIGTFLGGMTAAALAWFMRPGPLAFVIGMIAMALLCGWAPLKTSAFRFAAITLAIILLPSRTGLIWRVAIHRFFEVAFGIVIGMAVMALWPQKQDAGAATSAR